MNTEEKNTTTTEKFDESASEIPSLEQTDESGDDTRLKRVKKSQLKRNSIITTIGIVLLTTALYFIGPTLVIQFSIFLDSFKSQEAPTSEEKTEAYIPPPVLNRTEKATKNSTVSISGRAIEGSKVELYRNNSLVDTTTTRENNTFSFQDITLLNGENEIKARAISDSAKSNFSDTTTIIYREKPPELSIATPQDGDTFTGDQATLKVTGKTSPYAKVTINGSWAIMDDEGNFQYNYIMQSGDNKLQAVTIDEADNKTEQEINFTYSP